MVTERELRDLLRDYDGRRKDVLETAAAVLPATAATIDGLLALTAAGVGEPDERLELGAT